MAAPRMRRRGRVGRCASSVMSSASHRAIAQATEPAGVSRCGKPHLGPRASDNDRVFLNILVGIDGSASAGRALEHAVDLARAGNSKLTLMTVAPPVSMYVTLGGVAVDTMTTELDNWAKDVLDEAVRALPDDVSAHTVQRRGHAGPE